MLNDLFRWLSGPASSGPQHSEAARVALAALMVRMSRSDGDYTAREAARIDGMLRERYGIDAGAAATIRRQAEIAEDGAQDTVQFTRLIKDTVPYEDRIGVVETLWAVASANSINADERGLMRLVANLLGVSDQDSALARQRALGRG